MDEILGNDHSKGVCWCQISAMGVEVASDGGGGGSEETVVGSVEKESERCILESNQFMGCLTWISSLLLAHAPLAPLGSLLETQPSQTQPSVRQLHWFGYNNENSHFSNQEMHQTRRMWAQCLGGWGGAEMSVGVKVKAGHLPPHPALTASAPSLWTQLNYFTL